MYKITNSFVIEYSTYKVYTLQYEKVEDPLDKYVARKKTSLDYSLSDIYLIGNIVDEADIEAFINDDILKGE